MTSLELVVAAEQVCRASLEHHSQSLSCVLPQYLMIGSSDPYHQGNNAMVYHEYWTDSGPQGSEPPTLVTILHQLMSHMERKLMGT